MPPGLAKKCGQVDEPYPDENPAGPRDGWEHEYKQGHRDILFTNDVSLALPEPLEAEETDQSQWKETYAYGAAGERLSMTYQHTLDANNGWEPTPGVRDAGATVVGPKTLYYMSDALGSTLGMLTARYHYDEFGTPTDAKKFDLNWPGPDNLFGYTGLGYDFNSGLSYARARYYQPEIGQFISEDTYKGQLFEPQSQNLYTYVGNNPLTRWDPNGHAYATPDGGTGAVMSKADIDLLNKYSELWYDASLINDTDTMQAAHDAANLIRLQYYKSVIREDFQYGGQSIEYTKDMYNETYHGSAKEDTLSEAIFDTLITLPVGLIMSAGKAAASRAAYEVGDEVYNAAGEYFGKVVSNPKQVITSYSKHVLQRMEQRTVTNEMMQGAIDNAELVLWQERSNTYLYISNEAVVAVSTSGKAVTTYSAEQFDETIRFIIGRLTK